MPTPAVVAALEKHGLECLDEAYDPWLVKGCYAHADQRIVMVRMKVDASAGIEKFLVQVLDGNVSAAARDAEFGVLLELHDGGGRCPGGGSARDHPLGRRAGGA